MKNYTKCNMSNTERKWHKKTWLVYWSASYIFDSMLFKTHVSRYFWIRNLSFPDTASVHMHPVNPAYESATFWIRSPEWKFLNTLWIRNRVDAKFEYFLSGDVTRSSRVLYREYCVLYSRWQPLYQVVSLTRRRRSRRGPWERGCSRWLPPCHVCSVVNIPRGVLGTRVDG